MKKSQTIPSADNFPERYQILQLLGSGGSGDAYLAWDTSLRRQIVVKRVRTDSSDENAVPWILEEAGKMAALKHPNIVAVHDVALSEGVPCIIMEHVIGHNLDDLVTSTGPLRLEAFVELAQQTLDALFAAHQTGMIHRDLKPSNVMITDLPSGSIQSKLLDFGLAKFINTQAPSPQTVSIDGSIHGTTHYISPEQLSREPVGVYSDLYSLGCTLYFGLTGQPPFGGSNVSEVITSHLSHLVTPPSALRIDLTPSLCEWLMQMIARHPHERFANALVALHALRDAAYADQISLRTTTTSIPVSRWTMPMPLPLAESALLPSIASSKPWRAWIPVGLGLVGAVALGLFVALSNPSPRVGLRSAAVDVMPRDSEPVLLSEVPVSPPLPSEEVAVVSPPPIPPVPASPAPSLVSSASEPVSPLPKPEVVFRVVGSNTIGAKLLPKLMEKFLERMEAKNIRREASSLNEETLMSFEIPGTSGRQAVLMKAHGSSTAFEALQNGTCDIGMSSRPVNDKEVDALRSLGDLRSSACEHVVGLDGLAVIVSRSNPLSTLTLPQVAAIFSGKIRDWSELGGTPGPINLYARDDQSGTFDSFRSMVLGKLVLDSSSKRYEDSGKLSDDVSKDANGIGFIGLPYVKSSKALALSDAGARAMLPTPFSVATEDYVLSRRLFLYSSVVPRHPWIVPFMEFSLSDAGQQWVEEVGFISQQVGIERVSVAENMPERYRDLAETAEGRLSLSFRFRSGRTQLDAKAVRDLDRVVKLLSKPENRRKQVSLLGFSDLLGSRTSNIKLSEERAKEISAQLALRGVAVTEILPMGSEMPVASNDSSTGQEKNRRVEIWVGRL